MPTNDGVLQEAARELLEALKNETSLGMPTHRAIRRLEVVLSSEEVEFLPLDEDGEETK